MLQVHHYHDGDVAITGIHGIGPRGLTMTKDEYKELCKAVISDPLREAN